MTFSDRLSNGWKLCMNSFQVLSQNRHLVVFPMLSGISLVLIMASFVAILFGASGWQPDAIDELGTIGSYALMFTYYLVNYFVVVFFNTALTHCTRLYFSGEEVTIKKGLLFSMSRLRIILFWAVFAATVGTVLKIIQENVGFIGKLITGAIGIIWSVATFFVVPVIAYENVGPVDAFKRSSQLMKEKWGESLVASFSFGLIQVAGILVTAIPLFLLGALIHVIAGVVLAMLGIFLVIAIISATKTIFISAVYCNINGDSTRDFKMESIDNLFLPK